MEIADLPFDQPIEPHSPYPCTVGGAMQACNDGIAEPMISGAIGGGVAGAVPGGAGIIPGAIVGGTAGGLTGCAQGMYEHLQSCWHH